MYKLIIPILSLTMLLWANNGTAVKKFEYVGASKCKMCHKKASKGNQYGKWEESLHAKSLEALKTDKAAEIAKKLGLKTSADQAPECLVCHTTGFGKGGYEVKDAKFWDQVTDKGKPVKEVKRMTSLQNVGCEACHGPGSKYKSKKIMTAVFKGETAPETVGLNLPDEQTCLGCHNEKNPTFDKEKGFKYSEMVKKIAHPYPEDIKKELKSKK